MSDYQMGTVESKFADIIWDSEPISSSDLSKISAELFGWKKSTTYTVLKRLCEKGIFKNEKGTVASVITRDEFYSLQSENFVKETFGGSLPAFLTAFTKRNSLTREQAEILRRMVREFDEKEAK